MKQLIKRTQIIWLFILAISFVGCNEDDDVNLPEVVASFAKTINADTGTVSFLNLSENADSYTWDFGDGTSSTEINPIKSFATGTYTVALTAENGAGASSTFEDELVVDIPLPVGLPITFDDPNVNYDVTTFGGVTFEIVDNPDASGSNTSNSKVGAITNGGAAFEGFYFDLGRPIELATLKSIKVNFWSDTPIDVLLKLEEGTAGAIEATASHGGTGWEETFFNFDADASYSRFTLFVDPIGSTAGTFYIDDIEQAETPAASNGCIGTPIAATSLPLDFEGCATFPSEDNFGGGITSELAVNPSKTGINTSDFVLKVDKPTGSDFFAGIQNTFASNFDLTTTNVFKLKVYSTKADAIFRFELALNPQSNPVTGNPAPVFVTIPAADEWIEVEVIFTGLPGGPTAYNQLVIKPDNDQADSAITAGGTYYLDDLKLEAPATGGGFDDGLLTNGDFESGATPWIQGIDDNSPAPVVTENGNSFYSIDITTPNPGEPFAVNLSQKLEITPDATYELTFDAWSDRDRSIIAGIGLSGGSFANTAEPVNINATRQTYTLTLTAAGFGDATSRVLFDVNGEAGLVNIDNVSLFLDGGSGGDTVPPVITLNGDPTVDLSIGDTFTDPGATATDNVDGDVSGNIVVGGDTVDTNTEGTYVITYNVSDAAGNTAMEVTRTVNVIPAPAFDDGLLTNGDFENGAAPWIQGVDDNSPAPVVTENGNSFYSIDITTPNPGEPFAVNLSQKLEITPDATYELTFDAWSDRDRSIIAGIGLSGGSFANTAEPVNITATRQTYTLTLTAAGFGDATSRVLFDVNGEAGLVNIDNVSLVLDGGGSPPNTCPAPPAGDLVSNGDFETGTESCWDVFQNGGSAALDNTINNGGTWSGKLSTNGPSNPAFKQERIGAGTVAAGDLVTITFDHIGSVVQPGAVFNVLLFGEGTAGASFTHVFNPAPALSGTWTTYTGTFTIPAGTDVTDGVSFLIQAVCGGDAGCSVSANIDNVSIKLN